MTQRLSLAERTLCQKCLERVQEESNDYDFAFHTLCRACRRRMGKLRDKAVKQKQQELRQKEREAYLNARYAEVNQALESEMTEYIDKYEV